MAITMFTATVTTPGTPQRLISAVAPAFPTISGKLSGTVFPKASVIVLQADPTNTASKNIYIGGSALNATTRAGIGLALAPGAISPPISLAEGAVALSEIFIDVDAAATTKNLFVTVVG